MPPERPEKCAARDGGGRQTRGARGGSGWSKKEEPIVVVIFGEGNVRHSGVSDRSIPCWLSRPAITSYIRCATCHLVTSHLLPAPRPPSRRVYRGEKGCRELIGYRMDGRKEEIKKGRLEEEQRKERTVVLDIRRKEEGARMR